MPPSVPPAAGPSGAAPGAAVRDAAQNVRDAVRGVVDAYAAAWNRHDVDAMLALFAPDAEFVNVFGAWWRDRAAIRAGHAAIHAPASAAARGASRDTRWTNDEVVVRPLAPGVAAAHVRWTQTGQRDPADDAPLGPRTGVMTLVLARVPSDASDGAGGPAGADAAGRGGAGVSSDSGGDGAGWRIVAGQNTDVLPRLPWVRA